VVAVLTNWARADGAHRNAARKPKTERVNRD